MNLVFDEIDFGIRYDGARELRRFLTVSDDALPVSPAGSMLGELLMLAGRPAEEGGGRHQRFSVPVRSRDAPSYLRPGVPEEVSRWVYAHWLEEAFPPILVSSA